MTMSFSKPSAPAVFPWKISAMPPVAIFLNRTYLPNCCGNVGAIVLAGSWGERRGGASADSLRARRAGA